MVNASNNTTPQNAVNAATGTVVQLKTIDELRATEPTSAGEIASVLEYTKGSKMGGGVFVYDATDTTSPDDGGIVFIAAGNKRWKRVIQDYSTVTVLDFGAIADGKTDCIEAVKRMFTWSQRVLPAAGIRFTAGVFSMSTFDISDKEINRFKVSGANVNFGYFPTTTLTFNWGTQPRGLHFFKVNARYAEISGIVVKGMSSNNGGDGGTAFNKVGFYANIITGGQFLRVSSMEFRYLGGRALDLIDTLDCKIDQFYSRGCQDSIVYARWSDRAAGAWDHSTAIELSNFNLQENTLKPVLDLPRCTQSFIRNGWIEHSEFAGDLTNGQWVIEGLAIESTTNPLKLGYCRALIIQKSIHNQSAGFDYSTAGIEPWSLLAEGDRGLMEISDWGAIIQGSLNYDYITSQHHMDNRSDKEKWFYIGEFNFSDEGTQIHVRVVGTSQILSQSATQTQYSGRTPEGVANIYLQARNNANTIGSWYGEGSCPVTKVHIEGGATRTKLYVKLAQFTGFATAQVETNGKDRYKAGLCFIFRKSYAICSDDDAKRLDAAPVVAFEQHWIGNEKVGIGYNNDKELLLNGTLILGKPEEYEPGKWRTRRYLKVRVNGDEWSIPLNSATEPYI
ncbi:hypothetical protein [Pantoea sp. GL120224-02]|uniref:hypothetical protein n=1 Tax=Pantoea sp. GL120224-02 TaxID=1378084 RepID=UPI000BCAEA89|nr:hypothetical protein [Pantoea sp. GL120224-02]SNY64584.1 amylovoran biosynthesis protein AmsF [Pantoea sp. GL120224-02]